MLPNLATHRTSSGLAAALMTLVLTVPAGAAIYTWTPGLTGSSSVAGNWLGGVLPPTDNTADVIIDGEGTLGSVFQWNGNPSRFNSIVISAGDAWRVSTSQNLDLLNNNTPNPSFLGTVTNAGTMQATGAGVSYWLFTQTAKAFTNTGIMEAANGAQIVLFKQGGSYTNTGGTFRAVTGGSFEIRGNPESISGGSFYVDPTSKVTAEIDVQPKFNLTNVATVNEGTWTFNMSTAVGGGRQKGITLTGGTFDNRGTVAIYQQTPGSIVDGSRATYLSVVGGAVSNSGTLDISNTCAGTGATLSAYMNLDATSTLTTTPTSIINVTQNSTTGTSHLAYLTLANPAGFTNNGQLNIRYLAASVPTGSYAKLTSSGPVTNNGTVTVSGLAATLDATGKVYTQAAGRTQISGGGQLLATTVNVNGGKLAGDGTIVGAVNVNTGGALAPGNSPGLMTVTGSLTFAPASLFEWELDQVTAGGGDQSALRGTDPGYDAVNVSGAVTITAGIANPITLDILGLAHAAHTAGLVANWGGADSYSWPFLTANGGISGFAESAFTLRATSFAAAGNSIAGHRFQITQSGNSLILSYFVPEPGTAALLGIALAGMAARRRR